MPSSNVFETLRAGVGAEDRACLRSPDGRQLSYAQVRSQSARFAHALQAAGVRAGDRVAAQTDKSFEAVLLYLATLRIGAVYLPLNTAYTAAELSYFLTDAEPSLFVVTPQKLAQLSALAQQLHVPACLTLGADGSGTLAQLSCCATCGVSAARMCCCMRCRSFTSTACLSP